MTAIELNIRYNAGKILLAEVLPCCERYYGSLEEQSDRIYPCSDGSNIIVVDWIICNGYFFNEDELFCIRQYCNNNIRNIIGNCSKLNECVYDEY